jgi:hypothetical protein
MKKIIFALLSSQFLFACGGSSDSPENVIMPVAIIESQMTDVIVGDNATLSADKSTGESVLTYQWQLNAKPDSSTATLLNSSTVNVEIQADVSGDYVLKLVVSTNQLTSSATYTLTVGENTQPQISTDLSLGSLLENNTVILNELLRIDASSSVDAEGRELTFNWSIEKQPEQSSLTGITNIDYFDFSPEVTGVYQISLTINDGYLSNTELFDFEVIQSKVELTPSLDSSLTAIQQVEDKFASGSVDLPESHDAEHLTIEHSSLIGDHFVYLLHLEEDGDRDLPIESTDRQRAEIKTYANSSDDALCTENDRMRLSWPFKANDLNLSTSFTHFFQIKGSADHPLLTITAKRSDGAEALRINYGEQDTILGSVDWNKANDRWLQVDLEWQCNNQGYLKLVITDVENQEKLIEIDESSLAMWQNIESDTFGYKFGFYRKVKANIGDINFKAGLESLEDKIRIGQITIEKL